MGDGDHFGAEGDWSEDKERRLRDGITGIAKVVLDARDAALARATAAEAELAMLMESTDGVRQAVGRWQERAREAESREAGLKAALNMMDECCWQAWKAFTEEGPNAAEKFLHDVCITEGIMNNDGGRIPRVALAVLREVLVPQPEPADLPPKPLPWASAPTVQEFKDALARLDRLETMRQCNDCGWKNRRGCIPPLNGGKCLDWYSCFEPRRTTPVRADLTLTALRLDALRLEGVLRRASNDICEILSAPAAETRTCSGDWDNCTCMRCKLMRLRDWILRRAKETMP